MNIFIDPSQTVFLNNQLFNDDKKGLNANNSLDPFLRLRHALAAKNINLQTADFLLDNLENTEQADYYSFGLMDNLDRLENNPKVRLKAFFIFEPPVVDPKLYQALPRLTQLFSEVYLYNTVGDNYSLTNVDQSKLRKFYFPQPFASVLEQYWNRSQRMRRIVIINGNHKPHSYKNELYSARMKAIKHLKKYDAIDLYGRNWNKWFSGNSMWLPYWLNRNAILSVYKGACDSKYEVLSQYDFCLCFENMEMRGYITEKIFDCFYAGTVPIYWGASDIEDLIPANTYIDFRDFKNYQDLQSYLMQMPQAQIEEYKHNARNFVSSQQGLKYYNFMEQVINACSLGESYA